MSIPPLFYVNEAERWHTDLLAAVKLQKLKRSHLGQLLAYTPDALGRRLRGEAPWSLADYGLLTDHLDLVPIAQHHHLRFAPASEVVPGSGFEPEAYLGALEHVADLRERDGYDLDVITTDLPIFYFLADPLLSSLKLLLFTANASPVGGYRAQPRQLRHFQVYAKRAAALSDRYFVTLRREIWGPDPLRSFCHQLEGLAAAHKLDGVDLEAVADALRQLMKRLQSLAAVEPAVTRPLSLRYEPERAVVATYLLRKGSGPGLAFVSLDNPHFVRNADGHTARHLTTGFDLSWQRGLRVTSSKTGLADYFKDVDTTSERRIARLLALNRKK